MENDLKRKIQTALFFRSLHKISVTILVGGKPRRYKASTAVNPCLIPMVSIRKNRIDVASLP
ncbi:hypothetical protein DRO54_11455 [Candidatus Bathyarchaeota archaeon]|nr:MAG: hypothetical protein DRO54_11455 [Candidatus Bathyarchaeota archaeon]